MINARVTREAMTLDGKSYAKGARLKLSENQFADLGPAGIGWVELVPAAAPRSRAAKSRA